MEKEIWKDVLDYEGGYQVSNLGNVKSLKLNKEKILKPGIDSHGYLRVDLFYKGKRKTIKVHQLVAMAFLNHTPDGTTKIVTDHIDNNPLNNRLENLQLISQRENLSKDKNGTSKYTGVSWDKERNKWRSEIRINGKIKYLGRFNSEEEASEYYQRQLMQLKQLNK